MKKIVTLCLLLSLVLSGCGSRTTSESSRQIFAMDTVMDLYAQGQQSETAITQAVQEINRLEALLSRTREGSEVWQLNQGQSVALSADTEALLSLALELSAQTGGAFDITVAPLVTAWGIHTESPRVVPEAELAALLALVGSSHIHREGDRTWLDQGCAIDLGAIAKGYASDLVAQLYRDSGVTGGWASLGGNVYAHGTKPDGSPWSVAIRDPHDAARTAALVALSNQFAITSGGYQRNFTAPDGTVYQHILDPQTGKPARSDLLSVTVIAESGTRADALSTALYVMGEAGACRFWQEHRAEFDMVLITPDGRILCTAGMAEHITVEEGGPYELHILP